MILKKKQNRAIGWIVLMIASSLISSPALASRGNDKVLHAVGSAIISTAAYNVYIKKTEMTKFQAQIAAVVTTLAVGAIKESLDDHFDGGDMGANAGGAILGATIAFEF